MLTIKKLKNMYERYESLERKLERLENNTFYGKVTNSPLVWSHDRNINMLELKTDNLNLRLKRLEGNEGLIKTISCDMLDKATDRAEKLCLMLQTQTAEPFNKYPYQDGFVLKSRGYKICFFVRYDVLAYRFEDCLKDITERIVKCNEANEDK